MPFLILSNFIREKFGCSLDKTLGICTYAHIIITYIHKYNGNEEVRIEKVYILSKKFNVNFYLVFLVKVFQKE